MQRLINDYLNVDFQSDFLNSATADELLSTLKTITFPNRIRSTILYGDKGLIYTVQYKEKTSYHPTIEWQNLPLLLTLKKKLEHLYHHEYNFCAVMRYEDGNAIIKKHRDKEMVSGSSIVGISVGATRRFKLSPPYWLNANPIILNLNHGSLYALLPPTNDKWTHEILTDDTHLPRFSLTFRNIPPSFLTTSIPIFPKCQVLLKTGLRKGQSCNATIYNDATTCKRHQKKV